MKLLLLSFVILTVAGCRPNQPTGKYFCDQVTKTTVVREGTMDHGSLDINCLYKQLEFKGDNKVIVSVSEGFEFSTTYEMDDDKVRIKNDKLDMVLKMQDKNTLIGEGMWKGIYKKL